MQPETRGCSIEGCGNKYRAKGLCATHLSQIKRRGEIPTSTRLSPNKIIVDGDVATIVLCRSGEKHLGQFQSTELAVQARREAERKYFGEFARQQ